MSGQVREIYLLLTVLFTIEHCTDLIIILIYLFQNTPAHERDNVKLGIYGIWQTEEYKPPPAKDVSKVLLIAGAKMLVNESKIGFKGGPRFPTFRIGFYSKSYHLIGGLQE